MWGEEGVGEIGMEAPASKEDDSMEDEERGERERLKIINLCLLLFVRDMYLEVMGCKSTELESPSSTLLSGPYPLSFWVSLMSLMAMVWMDISVRGEV